MGLSRHCLYLYAQYISCIIRTSSSLLSSRIAHRVVLICRIVFAFFHFKPFLLALFYCVAIDSSCIILIVKRKKGYLSYSNFS